MLRVGRVDKPHGLRGEVVVSLSTNRDERVAVGSVLALDGPDARQLTIIRSQPFMHRWIVVFDGVFDRTGAEEISHRDLFAEPLDDADALWVHELVGRELFDQYGTSRGRVAAVEANPASDLLVLDSGALVPLTFVVATEPEAIRVEVPDGLFD